MLCFSRLNLCKHDVSTLHRADMLESSEVWFRSFSNFTKFLPWKSIRSSKHWVLNVISVLFMMTVNLTQLKTLAFDLPFIGDSSVEFEHRLQFKWSERFELLEKVLMPSKNSVEMHKSKKDSTTTFNSTLFNFRFV